MSTALTPLRHAYGVEPTGLPPGPGGPEHAEFDLLRQMRGVLDGLGERRGGPSPEAVGAVLARAEEATRLYADDLPAIDPALRPLATALGLSAPAGTSVEQEILEQSLAALDAAPMRRPSAEAVAAVFEFAAEASASVDAVRAVYGEGEREAADSVEAAVLRQSREAIDGAVRNRPRLRPPAAVVDEVLARAEEATRTYTDDLPVDAPSLAPLAAAVGLPTGPAAQAAEADLVEVAVLRQSADALDALGRPRPSGAAVAAVLARAAEASAEGARETTQRTRRAADRAAAPAARRRTPVGVWAGGAGLLAALLIAVFVLPNGSDVSGEAELTVADAAPIVAGPPDLDLDSTVEAETPASSLGAPAPSAAAAADPALLAVAETPAAPAPPAPRAAVQERTARAAAARPSARPSAPAGEPTWEVDQDLLTLSLRLEELDRETEGLGWDEPAEAFGMPPVGPTSAFTPGVQAVREGAAPARVRLRTDSSRVQR